MYLADKSKALIAAAYTLLTGVLVSLDGLPKDALPSARDWVIIVVTASVAYLTAWGVPNSGYVKLQSDQEVVAKDVSLQEVPNG